MYVITYNDELVSANALSKMINVTRDMPLADDLFLASDNPKTLKQVFSDHFNNGDELAINFWNNRPVGIDMGRIILKEYHKPISEEVKENENQG